LCRNDVAHNELFTPFSFLYKDEIISNLKRLDSDHYSLNIFINDKLILSALRKITFRCLELEKHLTKAREIICNLIANNKKEMSDLQIQFLSALGEQCFLNEYVYLLTKKESISITKIIHRCQRGEINETTISLLSCYFPLYKLLEKIPSLKSFNPLNKNVHELIKLQISEPIKEIEISKNIKKLGPIKNVISQKVKSQYEINPYPKWRYGNPSKKGKIIFTQSINSCIKPNYIRQSLDSNKIKVLIVGCGTGQQILLSQIYKNAQIIAIDLSLPSLSYAQRKVNEFGINNVKLIQMDILEINLLEEKFDVIECSGVLHHMDDPSEGLKVILSVLKNNGFLKLGLYSELARKDIVEARKYITDHKLETSSIDIKEFREKVSSGKIAKINNLRNWSDFYTMSECRDLCFHAKEHRFTIEKVKQTLRFNELKFLGFQLPQEIKSIYSNYFPKDKKQTNLDNWVIFEEKHPNTFKRMYQFWVCKTKS